MSAERSEGGEGGTWGESFGGPGGMLFDLDAERVFIQSFRGGRHGFFAALDLMAIALHLTRNASAAALVFGETFGEIAGGELAKELAEILELVGVTVEAAASTVNDYPAPFGALAVFEQGSIRLHGDRGAELEMPAADAGALFRRLGDPAYLARVRSILR